MNQEKLEMMKKGNVRVIKKFPEREKFPLKTKMSSSGGAGEPYVFNIHQKY